MTRRQGDEVTRGEGEKGRRQDASYEEQKVKVVRRRGDRRMRKRRIRIGAFVKKSLPVRQRVSRTPGD